MSETTISAATHVGENVPRADDVAKLTGGAVYTSDMVLPGMLHAQVKKSPHARARIVAIDTSKAESLPGVHAVLTGKELDYRHRALRRGQGHARQGRSAALRRGRGRRRRREPGHRQPGRRSDRRRVRGTAAGPEPAWTRSSQDAPRVHPDLGSYEYVEAAFSPQPGTNIPNLTRIRKGDVEAGLRRGGLDRRARVHQSLGAARPLGDPRRHRRVEGGRRGDHLDERAVALHRARPVLPRLQARRTTR